MAIANTDYFLQVGSPGTATTLSAPGYTIGNTTINVASTGSFPTATAVIFAVDTVSTTTGAQVENTGSYCVFVGIVTSSTSIGSLSLLYGTPQNYAAAATTRVFITVSSQHTNRLVNGILQQHTQTGTHTGITTDTLTATGTVTAANFVQTGGAANNGWTVGLPAPNTVTNNGNGSYNWVWTGTDQTGVLSPGMRLRTTRTVAAPVSCANLNGSTQYFSKTSPAGMTFTNNFVAPIKFKLSAYPASAATLHSRYNGTSGWTLRITSSGQVNLIGVNGGSTNQSSILSYQSVPLNKWVTVVPQLDMATFTATPTTSYIMINDVDVPCAVSRGGTNPTALVQAGNYEVGSENGGLFPFPGKIAQAAVFNAKVTQATMVGYSSQSYSGTETSLISAYSLSGATGANDLNTTNANNLTANGSATTTAADAPWTQDATGTPTGNFDFMILQKGTYSGGNTTAVVQVPEGCTISTSGGVSAVVYSSNASPYGFPSQTSTVFKCLLQTTFTTTSTTATQILGLTGTFTPQQNREYRITIYSSGITNSAANKQVVTLWNGTVGSGTQLESLQADNYTGTAEVPGTLVYTGFLPAGSPITLNAGFKITAASGTGSFSASATSPAYMQVEAMGII